MEPLNKITEELRFDAITTEPVVFKAFQDAGILVDVLHIDKIHPVISGNKWFKLKYHLQTALERSADVVITFGGAWSNHLVATAWACRLAGLQAIGIVRGEKPSELSNTLKSVLEQGMTLHFVSRDSYRSLTSGTKNDLSPFLNGVGVYQTIPEGGAGSAGVRGASEILALTDADRYTHIACCIGTSTMFAGLVRASTNGQKVIGVPVLKGFTKFDGGVKQELNTYNNWELANHFHFGGYARKTEELLQFMNDLYESAGIETDFVYTGKLFYACAAMAGGSHIPKGSRLLIIHSGGLQGNLSLPAGVLRF